MPIIQDSSWVNIRIMFDSGSKRTYINEYFKEMLNLKTLKTKNLILKTFGNKETSVKYFNFTKIKLNGVRKIFVLEALVLMQICSELILNCYTGIAELSSLEQFKTHQFLS